MKNHLIDTVGHAVEQQYSGFQLALTGLVADGMTGAVPTSPRACAMFAAGAAQLEASTLTSIASLLDSAIHDTIDIAMKEAGVDLDDEAAREQLTAPAIFVRNEVLGTLAAAMHKDTQTATKRFRDFTLRAQLLMANRGYPYASAIQSARIAEQAKPLSFAQLDSLGRKWRPSLFAGAAVRAALQASVYADTFVRAAAMQGASVLEIRYPDPGHEGNGQRVSLTGDGAPGYLSLRDEVFHPNSSATLAVVG